MNGPSPTRCGHRSSGRGDAVAVDSTARCSARCSPSSNTSYGLVVRSAEDLDALSDDDVARNSEGTDLDVQSLHAVDYHVVGLESRQARRIAARQAKLWARQWVIVKSRELADVDTPCGRRCPIERLRSRETPSSCTGDSASTTPFWLKMIRGVVRAVVDWEMSTLGDPLTDIVRADVRLPPARRLDTVLGF